MTGGGKAQHLTESLGQRDNGLLQQLGVSAEWKKEQTVRGKADDSVRTHKRYKETERNHLCLFQKQTVRRKHRSGSISSH